MEEYYDMIIEDVAMGVSCGTIKNDLDTFKVTEVWIPDPQVGGDCFDMLKAHAPSFLELIEASALERFLETHKYTQFK